MSAFSRDPLDGLTTLLARVAGGDGDAIGRLWRLVHGDVRAMAAGLLRREGAAGPGEGLEPTVIVSEVWLRIHGGSVPASFDHRRHFFGAVATAMRRVLVDHARARRRLRRGGGGAIRTVPLQFADHEIADPGSVDPAMLEAAIDALDRMAEEHPRAAEVARLRYLAGLEVRQIANILDISERTVGSDWVFARAWLRRAIRG